MTAAALSRALSLGDEVVAVSVQFDEEAASALEQQWERWQPGVPLTILRSPSRSIAKPMLAFIRSLQSSGRGSLLVLIPEVEPQKRRHRILQNQRGIVLANVLRRHSDVTVARIAFKLRRD